jgi:hypothetical protein
MVDVARVSSPTAAHDKVEESDYLVHLTPPTNAAHTCHYKVQRHIAWRHVSIGGLSVVIHLFWQPIEPYASY